MKPLRDDRRRPALKLALAVLTLALIPLADVRAEGSYLAGLNQPIYDYDAVAAQLTSVTRPFYVDIITAGEVINVSACGEADSDDITIEIYDPYGTRVVNTTLTDGNVSCADPLTAPLTGALKYAAPMAGKYEVHIYNVALPTLKRVDITVTPNAAAAPDPTATLGRVYAKSIAFNAGTYAKSESTDANFFILTPGGFPDRNYVWQLDLNKFSGFIYELHANDIGVNPPNSGLSTERDGNSVTQKYPLYFSYPAIAKPLPGADPSVMNASFRDDAGTDSAFSPGVTPGVEDTGNFTFSTDVTGTYAIVIDTDRDGSYAATDTLILGVAAPGTNAVNWDGRNNLGDILPAGRYNARVQVRIGEYHFIATDVETSGGDEDGLTIRQAVSNTAMLDTPVYWDDQTLLRGATTLPAGQPSSASAGRHTWGNFTSTGFGNERYIDTYVFGRMSFVVVPLTIEGVAPDPDNSVQTGNTVGNTVTPGQTVTFSVTLNSGTLNGTTVSSTDVTIDDVLDANLEDLVVASLNGCGTYTDNSNDKALRIVGADIAAGTDCVITFTARVRSPLPAGTVVHNTVTVSPSAEGVPGYALAWDKLTVGAPDGAGVSKPSPAAGVAVIDLAACTAGAATAASLSMSAALYYRISENPQFSNVFSWTRFSSPTTVNFVLSSGFGTKRVYAQFRDGDGTDSPIVSDSIEYKADCASPPPATTPLDAPTVPATATAPTAATGCDLCAQLTYDVYIVNPDGSERHTDTPWVRVTRLADGTSRYSFEDKSLDSRDNALDHNDAVVDVDKRDCRGVRFAFVSAEARWRHQIRFRVSIDGVTQSDILVAADDDAARGTSKTVDATAGVNSMSACATAPTTAATTPPATATAPTVAACGGGTTFTAPLFLNSTNIQVRPLQQRLQCLGYFPADIAPTGRFGPVTERSVRAFQSARGLPNSGAVDAATRAALNVISGPAGQLTP